MSTTLPRVDDPSDAELISAVRGGDVDAYGELFTRHVGSARRLARQLVSGPDVDDLVSEAFAKTLVVLQRGGGPDLAFRAYLLTAVRRLHVDRIRATSRLHHTDDLTPFDPGVPFRDTAVEGFENATAARAFASLPERWQLVLWHTEVEGQKPAEIAPLLGLSANSVSALAYRAREGLRQAFLSMHAQDTVDASCAWAQEHLGSYVRGGLSRRDSTRVEAHLEECRRCAAVYLELTEINSELSGLLAPLLLGGAAAAYLGSVAAGAGPGTLAVLLGRARDLVLAHAPATAVAGVAASAVVTGVLVHPFGTPDAQVPADAPGVGTSSPSTGTREAAHAEAARGPDHEAGGHGPARGPHRRDRHGRPHAHDDDRAHGVGRRLAVPVRAPLRRPAPGRAGHRTGFGTERATRHGPRGLGVGDAVVRGGLRGRGDGDRTGPRPHGDPDGLLRPHLGHADARPGLRRARDRPRELHRDGRPLVVHLPGRGAAGRPDGPDVLGAAGRPGGRVRPLGQHHPRRAHPLTRP